METIPDTFAPIFRSSPFLELLGPIYSSDTDSGTKIGFMAKEKHCNARGVVHGGVLTSLADIALGYNAAFGQQPPVPMVTANLTVDYAGSARLDDWMTG